MKRVNQALYLTAIILPALLAPAKAVAGAAIAGNVYFWGDSDGIHPIEIAAHQVMDGPPENAVTVSSPGGAYNLPVDDGNYWIGVSLDRNNSGGKPDPGEPLVWYDSDGDGKPDQVTVSGNTVSGIDIDLGFVYVDVDAGGANDGSSWSNAYTSLNDGIQAAEPGIEVWVADGTYKPGETRESHFALKNGVKVFGGFSGVEKNRLQRDPVANETILSGDIGTLAMGDNVYNVVWANGTNETALLDGVTITRGRADGAAPYDSGGGLYAYFGVATVVNVTFYLNYAALAGGGAATNAGVLHIYNSRFFTNYAGSFPTGLGGGFYGNTNGEKLVNCVFTGNQAGMQGGAIYMSSGSLGASLTGLSVYGNFAGTEAGGFFFQNDGASQTYTSNSIIWANSPPQVLTLGTVEVSDSIVQGGLAGGTNIGTSDPLFVDVGGTDTAVGTPDDNLRLMDTSPAIDAGNNSSVPPDAADLDGDLDTTEPLSLDMDFNARFTDLPAVTDTGSGTAPIIDMGAYEAFLEPLIFKDGFE